MNAMCTSCGMPMRSSADHAGADPAKDYCVKCARPDGTLKSYDEVLAGMIGFLTKTQGLDEGAARKAGAAMLAKMPKWAGR